MKLVQLNLDGLGFKVYGLQLVEAGGLFLY
jgi:hypothetical protein